MQTIVFATHNEDKLKEIRAIVNDIPGMEEFNIISMAAAGRSANCSGLDCLQQSFPDSVNFVYLHQSS